MTTHAVGQELRTFADKLRMGRVAVPSADNAMAIGDAILDGLEAADAMDALEDEIREEAEAYRLIGEGETVSTPMVWERLRERIAEDGTKLDEATEELFAIRSALIATGALTPDDTTTPLAGLITALFST